MIILDRADVLDRSVDVLQAFARKSGARGRFVALYLGLRAMGDRIAPLGSSRQTPASEIESYLDDMWTKVHRPGERRVLTAPFGGGSPVHQGYSTRTGVVPIGLRYPANTWRNNLGIQKGVGCAAGADVVATLVANPDGRMACPYMQITDAGRHMCGISGTEYRGEEHAIWLRSEAGSGHQVVNLDDQTIFAEYLAPGGHKIPIYPLIAVLYTFALPGFYPARLDVGIGEFASDFNWSISAVEKIFDCNPASEANAFVLDLVSGPLAASDGPSIMPLDAPIGDSIDETLPELGEDILLNSGLGAELAVARMLKDYGWRVFYTANQDRLGYDLRAEQGDDLLRIEVKSSIGFVTPELTQSEWDAASRYGDSFVLALVDFYDSDRQSIWFVRDPFTVAQSTPRTVRSYRLLRGSLEDFATDAEML